MKVTVGRYEEGFLLGGKFMAKGKSLLLGFIIGGTVSAIATLLSTPSSGRDFRKRVKDQSNEWKEILINLKQDSIRLKDQIAETSKEGVALIKNLTQDMKQSIEEWKEAVEPHQENIHKYLEEIEQTLQELENKVKNRESLDH